MKFEAAEPNCILPRGYPKSKNFLIFMTSTPGGVPLRETPPDLQLGQNRGSPLRETPNGG